MAAMFPNSYCRIFFFFWRIACATAQRRLVDYLGPWLVAA